MERREELLEFRVLEDRPHLFHSLVELTTTDKVYYDIWTYDVRYTKDGMPQRRYETSIKKWCEDNGKSYILYHAID